MELKTLQMKLDQEVIAHKETVAKFNADKKHILMSTEEANLEAMKGLFSVHLSIINSIITYDSSMEFRKLVF